MPGGSEFRLHQGFGLRPKHLHGAKAPRARRPLQRNAVSFSYAYAKSRLSLPRKACFCIDWVPHTANRASCECSPSREGTPCSDFGRTHLNAPTRSEEPEHFRPQFLLVSPLPAGMGWHPAVHCYRTRTIFFAIPGNFCSSMMSDRLWPDYRCISLLRKREPWHGQSQVCSWEFHFSAQPYGDIAWLWGPASRRPPQIH